MRYSHLSLSQGGKPVSDGWFEKSNFIQAIGLSSEGCHKCYGQDPRSYSYYVAIYC